MKFGLHGYINPPCGLQPGFLLPYTLLGMLETKLVPTISHEIGLSKRMPMTRTWTVSLFLATSPQRRDISTTYIVHWLSSLSLGVFWEAGDMTIIVIIEA